MCVCMYAERYTEFFCEIFWGFFKDYLFFSEICYDLGIGYIFIVLWKTFSVIN